MVQFAGFASRPYGFRPGYPIRGGLPHSDIPGSTFAPNSPGLFAGCHVLRRLLVPRHPPDALKALDPPYAGANPTHGATSAFHTPAIPCPSPAATRRTESGGDRRFLPSSHCQRCPGLRKSPVPASARPDDGGGGRVRTDDLERAKLALSQLSYAPGKRRAGGLRPYRWEQGLVGLGRLELPTSRLSGVRSDQLSYRPPSNLFRRGRDTKAAMRLSGKPTPTARRSRSGFLERR